MEKFTGFLIGFSVACFFLYLLSLIEKDRKEKEIEEKKRELERSELLNKFRLLKDEIFFFKSDFYRLKNRVDNHLDVPVCDDTCVSYPKPEPIKKKTTRRKKG